MIIAQIFSLIWPNKEVLLLVGRAQFWIWMECIYLCWEKTQVKVEPDTYTSVVFMYNRDHIKILMVHFSILLSVFAGLHWHLCTLLALGERKKLPSVVKFERMYIYLQFWLLHITQNAKRPHTYCIKHYPDYMILQHYKSDYFRFWKVLL